MIYFLHVSKCAGSSFIALARQNVRLHIPNANGNPINLVSSERLKFWRWRPEEQRYFLTSNAWQLVANENQMGRHAEFFDGVSYVTILREPIDRLFSAWQFAIEKPDKEEPLEERGRKFADFLRNGGLTWRRNYMLGTLTYQDRQNPRERLELGKQRLAQFDHVFLVESLGTDIKAMAKEGWTELDLPWRNTAAPGEAAWSAARAALADHPDLLQSLTEAHAEDLELFAYARELVERRKTEPPVLKRTGGGERRMPDSDDVEFVVSCAYEAFVNGDQARCEQLLAVAETLPDADEINIRKCRNLSEFALKRFNAPDRAEKEHRRKAREKKLAAKATAQV